MIEQADRGYFMPMNNSIHQQPLVLRPESVRTLPSTEQASTQAFHEVQRNAHPNPFSQTERNTHPHGIG